MVKKFAAKQDGYAMSWAIIMLVVVCLLSVLIISVSTSMLKRSSADYGADRAYVTARSVVNTIAAVIDGSSATVYEDDKNQNGSYSNSSNTDWDVNNLIPTVGQTIPIMNENLSFDEHNSGMSNFSDITIERKTEDQILISTVGIDGKDRATVTTELIRKEETHAPTQIGDFGDVFSKGLYATDDLGLNNRALLTATGDVYATDVSYEKNNTDQVAAIDGDFYCKTINSSPHTNSDQYQGRITHTGKNYNNWDTPNFSKDFYDAEKSLILLNDNGNNKNIDLTALKTQYSSNYYILYGEKDTYGSNSFKEKLVGTKDNNRTINSSTAITINDSDDYYIFVPKGAILNLNLACAVNCSPNVFIILDGKRDTTLFNQSLFGELFDFSLGYGFGGSAQCNLQSITGMPNFYVCGGYSFGDSIGANTGSIVNIANNTEISLSGAIFCSDIILGSGAKLNFTYKPLDVNQEGYTIYTWEKGTTSVDWGYAQ